MDDAEEQAANLLLRSGLAADQKTSRRIVREVVRSVLEDRSAPIVVHEGDIHTLDELANDIDYLIWDMETDKDHRTQLLEVADRAQHILRIARRYVVPESAIEPL